jgi:hypothetical protein
VISPAKAILPDVPLENAAVLIDALVNQKTTPPEDESWNPTSQAEILNRVYTEFHPKKELVESQARRQLS